ncbi:MAG: CocE/NonD family hydrolase [Acidobacteriota bacterium]|nr:CocE/NonD family hydrolase [Acidobacteriota bacterium]
MAGRLCGLPPPRTDFEVRRNITIPTRDGLFLTADHYRPTSDPRGTVLIRGPYGRRFPLDLGLARLFAARGYHAVFVSCRGTHGSQGDFRPMETEVADGLDVTAWLVAEPWFEGRFATIGPSYLGFTQWAVLTAPPAELAAAVVTAGPHDFADHAWGTGAFKLDFLGWSHGIVNQDRSGVLSRLRRVATGRRALRQALDQLPLVDAADSLLGGRAPWYREWVTRPDLDDAFWEPMRLGRALDEVNVPVLLIGGWQDLFLDQTLAQYAHLRRRGIDTALTVGPWNHYQTSLSRPVIGETFDWLEVHLAGRESRSREAAVRVHLGGAGEWRAMPAWPPATVDSCWHLRPGRGGRAHRLVVGTAPEAPGSGAGGSWARFTYDPARPTPALGGPMLSRRCQVDDTALADRWDVVTFDSDALGADLDVAGAPLVALTHRSDHPHFDLFVRLSEVDTRGRSRNLTEGYRRAPAVGADGSTEVAMVPVFHRVRAGHRIRLLIAGGSFPRFDRNLGTGEPAGLGRGMRPVGHAVGLGPEHASRLVLPVATEAAATGPPLS